MRSLPDSFRHDQQWESNPRPFDLESNALSTGPYAPTNQHTNHQLGGAGWYHCIQIQLRSGFSYSASEVSNHALSLNALQRVTISLFPDVHSPTKINRYVVC